MNNKKISKPREPPIYLIIENQITSTLIKFLDLNYPSSWHFEAIYLTLSYRMFPIINQS